MFELFLATVRLLDPKVPLASIITTSCPTLGDAGNVTVIGFDVVLAKIWSPSVDVYAVIVPESNVT
jgi:hypothetical protein